LQSLLLQHSAQSAQQLPLFSPQLQLPSPHVLRGTQLPPLHCPQGQLQSLLLQHSAQSAQQLPLFSPQLQLPSPQVLRGTQLPPLHCSQGQLQSLLLQHSPQSAQQLDAFSPHEDWQIPSPQSAPTVTVFVLQLFVSLHSTSSCV
jgi:hypothetical protein